MGVINGTMCSFRTFTSYFPFSLTSIHRNNSKHVHRLAVKSNLVDTGQEPYKYGFQGSSSSSPTVDRPVCPKPHRLGSSTVPEFLKPLQCNKHSQQNNDEESGILGMISEKTSSNGRESICSGCSPCCYSGSPPGRSSNPLIHDVQFTHQMEPFTRRGLSDKFGVASASPM